MVQSLMSSASRVPSLESTTSSIVTVSRVPKSRFMGQNYKPAAAGLLTFKNHPTTISAIFSTKWANKSFPSDDNQFLRVPTRNCDDQLTAGELLWKGACVAPEICLAMIRSHMVSLPAGLIRSHMVSQIITQLFGFESARRGKNWSSSVFMRQIVALDTKRSLQCLCKPTTNQHIFCPRTLI